MKTEAANLYVVQGRGCCRHRIGVYMERPALAASDYNMSTTLGSRRGALLLV